MDLTRSRAASTANGTEALFRTLLRGQRGRKLRAQLAAQHRDRTAEEIEEAVQIACRRFVDKAQGVSAPGQVYAWIRTTAHRELGREVGHKVYEIPVDPEGEAMRDFVAEQPGPEEEAIARENETELGTLVEDALASLPEIQRDILALYIDGCGRPEICSRLDLPDHTVKRELRFAIAGARAALAERVGGGCARGEQLVLRFVCGLATSAEASQARLHLSHCRRCELFSERLSVWREKVGALFPLPAAVEGASPGVLGRLAHRAADAVSSLRQQVVNGGAQLKQHASSAYYRMLDPTPLAGARPGTVAAVVAGCVTIGGGAATYCAQQGIDPLGAARSLLAGTEEHKPTHAPPAPPSKIEPAPSTAPLPKSEAPPASEATSPAEAKKESPPASPPPEASFEPSSPNYPYASSSEGSGATHTESPRPAPVPRNSPPEFEGP